MSIWSSLDGEPIPAMEGGSDDANYRGIGVETFDFDVATARGFHDRIRLAAIPNDATPPGGRVVGYPDMTALISPAAARELAARLITAAGLAESRNA